MTILIQSNVNVEFWWNSIKIKFDYIQLKDNSHSVECKRQILKIKLVKSN